MPNFTEEIVEDKARGRLVRTTDYVESEWPAHTPAVLSMVDSGSGFATPGSAAGALLLSVPSGYWFKPRTLWVTNKNANMNYIFLYEGGSATAASTSINGIYMEPNSTNFIALDCITCGKDLWVQADAASAIIKVGGLLVAASPEN